MRWKEERKSTPECALFCKEGECIDEADLERFKLIKETEKKEEEEQSEE